MKWILVIMTMVVFMTGKPATLDFGIDKGGEEWYALNDTVMGGLSDGELRLTDDSIIFSGKVSLENNGGFASIRSPWKAIDISQYENLEIRCRGYGQSFTVTFENDQRWFMPYYKKVIPLKAGKEKKWQTIKLPLREFDEYRIGSLTGELLTDELLQYIIRMGIMTADKGTEPFQLEIDYIKFE